MCVCSNPFNEGEVWAECVNKCGAWACSYGCSQVLANCPCRGVIDDKKRVGYVSWSVCQIIPWHLIILKFVPVDLSAGKVGLDVLGCLVLWPDVASLCHRDNLVPRTVKHPLGVAHFGAAQAKLRKENRFLYKVLKLIDFCIQTGRNFLLLQTHRSL